MRQLVPHFILEKFRDGQSRGDLTAAVLFADLTGFSSMSDALGRHGHHGSEMLAAVMQPVFEPLVHSVYAQGGFVVGFAGDAATAVFIDDDGRAAARCLAAAESIRRHFAERPVQSTSYGVFPIAVKLGLAYGETTWEIYRSVDGRQATFGFRGRALDASAHAEHHARPGEAWLDADFYCQVAAQVQVFAHEGAYRLDSVAALHPEQPLPDLAALPLEEITPFFSPAIVDLAQRGEFRPIVNVFIDLRPTDMRDDSVARFMRAVFALKGRYGGFFLRPDFGDKGINLLIFWGAPVAHETDIERALNFLLDLRKDSDIPFSAGVSYRLAYAGFVGAALREDYTGYGWGISLAARMMKSAATGEIWVDGEVAQRENAFFNFSDPVERGFKGFASPQKVYLLQGRREAGEQVFTGRFSGREEELARLQAFVEPVWQGLSPGMLVIKGDAGVGKSRLIHEFVRLDSFKARGATLVACQTDEIVRQAFNPFRYWLLRRFGISAERAPAENLSIFLAQVEQLAADTPNPLVRDELLRTRSVLAALLDLHWEGSLYSQLDAQGRYENTLIALTVLIRCLALKSPLVFILEDLQWLDDDSRAFLPHLLRSLSQDDTQPVPVVFLCTARSEGQAPPALGPGLLHELTLGGLDRAALAALACEKLGGPVADSLVDFLEKRAEGNPFFAEQSLQYLREERHLGAQAGVFTIADLDQVEMLSTDIQSILVARLDRLSQKVRDVVHTAAVLGREFELRLLLRMLNDQAPSTLVNHPETADIWVPLSEIRYIFRHALMRDAAYSMQLRSRQRELHALAVEAMETIFSGNLAPYVAELAHHAERAHLPQKAVLYLRQAGRQSFEAFQLNQSVHYLTRALRLTDPQDLPVLFDLHRQRSQAYSYLGDREREAGDMDRMTELAEQLDADLFRLQAAASRINHYNRLGRWQSILDSAAHAIALAVSLGDIDAEMDINNAQVLALMRLGRLDDALGLGNHTLKRAADHAHDLLEEAHLLNSLGLVCSERLEREQATQYFERAGAIGRKNGHLYIQAQVLNNLATLYAQGGDYITSRDYFRQAYALAREMGQRAGQGLVLGNLGWISGLLGDYHVALDYHTQAMAISREVNDPFSLANTYINLCAVAGYLGNLRQSIVYGAEGLKLARALDDPSSAAWAHLFLGYAYFYDGQTQAARDSFSAAIDIRAALGQPALRTEPLAGLAEVEHAAGNLSAACEHVEDILAHLESGGSLTGAEEPLRVILACYNVLKDLSDSRACAIIQHGRAILEESLAPITDETTRRMVVENVPWRRAVREIAEKLDES